MPGPEAHTQFLTLDLLYDQKNGISHGSFSFLKISHKNGMPQLQWFEFPCHCYPVKIM